MLNLRYAWRRIAIAVSLLGLLLTPSYTPARPVQAAVLGPRPLEGDIIVSIFSPLPHEVCLGETLKIEFGVMVFSENAPSKDDKYDPLAPPASLAPITVRAQAKLGKVSPGKGTISRVQRWASYDRTITYTAPRKTGKDMVTIAAFWGDSNAHGQDLEFEVKRCKYRAAIQSTEKDFSGTAEAQKLGLNLIMSFNAIGEFEQEEDSDNLKGNGTVDMWADETYLGNDLSCSLTQMLSGNGTFQIKGQAQGDLLSINVMFDPMAYSGFTFVCKGPEGSGSGGMPPGTSPSFAFKVTMPAEGGTQEYVHNVLTLHVDVFRRS